MIEEITGVVVLYKMPVSESNTIISLNKAGERISKKFKLYVYDNSPGKQEINNDRFDFLEITYLHNPANPGLSHAYNYCTELIKKSGGKWILLLDQDTLLPKDYFLRLEGYSSFIKNQNIDVLVPKVVSAEGRHISPYVEKRGGLTKPVEHVNVFPPETISAINSGSLVSVSIISKIGGFNADFPLDMLDFWLYRTLRKEKAVIFLADITLIHNLSVFNPKSSLTDERQKSILKAEKLYFKKYGTKTDQIIYYIRLIFRMIKIIILQKKYYSLKNIIFYGFCSK